MEKESARDDARDVLCTSNVECQVSADWRWFVAGPFKNSNKAKGFASWCEDMGLATDNRGSDNRYVKFF